MKRLLPCSLCLTMLACNPGEQKNPAEVDTLELNYTFEIHFPAETPVYGVSDMCRTPEGDFVLVNFRQPLLMKFDAKLKKTRTVTSAGRGPGDLNMPVKVNCGTDQIYVLEMQNSRVQVFNSGLNSVSVIPVPITPPFDFSISNHSLWVTGNAFHDDQIFSLHKVSNEGRIQVSAFEDEAFPIYSYRQFLTEGYLTAYHPYANDIRVYDEDLNKIRAFSLPSDLYTSLYENKPDLSDASISKHLREEPHVRISFAAYSQNRLIVHLRWMNPESRAVIVTLSRDGSPLKVHEIDAMAEVFELAYPNLYTYVYSPTENGSLRVTSVSLK